MQVHFKIEVDHFRSKSELQIGKNKLIMNKKMAKVCGLLNLQDKVSKIITDKNSGKCVFSVNKAGVTIDATGGNGKGVEIAISYDYPVWNEVSISSFQFILIDCDFVMEEIHVDRKEKSKNLQWFLLIHLLITYIIHLKG